MLNTFPYSAFTLGRKSLDMTHVARQIAPHVASVNASIEQRGEQRFQPHVEQVVERHAF